MRIDRRVIRTALSAVILALAVAPGPGLAQDRDTGQVGGGGAFDNGRDDDRSSSPFPPPQTRPPVQTPSVIIVVPSAPARTPPPRTTAPRPAPGSPIVPINETLRKSDIHIPLGAPNVVVTPEGRIEFLTLGPSAGADSAAQTLADLGVTVLRRSELEALGLTLFVLDLVDLDAGAVAQALEQDAPGFTLDAHNVYELAQAAPRLYAASVLDHPSPGACPLSAGIRIGQIDGPVEPQHPSFAGTRLTTHSVLEDGAPPVSRDHGTAVAALMVGNDGDGAFTGFATGAELFAVTAFSRHGVSQTTTIERVAFALDWLLRQDVALINMSFAGPVNVAMDSLLNATADRGVVLVAAAGNDGSDVAVYPAAAAAVIGVTSVDAALRRYRLANTGDHVDFAAPGVDLYVATSDSGTYATGTSYATPILTSLAARLISDGSATPDTVRTVLQARTEDLGAAGRDDHFGWGLVKSDGC